MASTRERGGVKTLSAELFTARVLAFIQRERGYKTRSAACRQRMLRLRAMRTSPRVEVAMRTEHC